MKDGGFDINISEVLALYNESGKSSEGMFFSVKYWKADGTAGQKVNVRRYAGKGHLTDERKDFRSVEKVERDAMKLFLIGENDKHPFEVFICLVTHFNGKKINHKF